MTNKAYFAMGVHFHQPVGNFDEILERAYRDCYSPFLETLTAHPDIKMSLHFSGNVLDFLEDRHSEYLDKVKELIDSAQVEIIGGGYYEPIFQAIPAIDRIGQINMLSDYSERRFSVRPAGMWMPERVWSPGLIKDFKQCNIKYSILDDNHLVKAGLSKDDLYGYFITGSNDNKIAIFPSDKLLRYSIPFKRPRATIDYFRKISKNKKNPLFTYGDDGEKFGEWPFTHDWVYKKGWLNNFFKELSKNKDWLNTVTFSEYLNMRPPLKEVHIPESSYEEMSGWSGGSWMNFLSRYPESNQMHKRMMYVSDRINNIEIRNTPVAKLGERVSGGKSEIQETIEKAKKELYKGQTNCSYWHGVFGGIYHHHLRNAVYEHLINADRISDEIESKGQNGRTSLRKVDFYDDGKKTLVAENKDFFISIDNIKGGIIRELDYKKKSVNLINTLARQEESYHKKMLDRMNNRPTEPLEMHELFKKMNPKIKGGIFYDKHTRSCLIDHFIDKDLGRVDFEKCNYIDLGDFASSVYADKIEGDKIVLSRNGSVGAKALSLTKELRISSDTEIEIKYILKNKSISEIDAFLGIEFNITMPHAGSERYSYVTDKRYVGGLDGHGSISAINSFSIKDSRAELGTGLIFSANPNKLWYFPVYTVSQSERTYDLTFQSSCIFPIWHIQIAPGQEIQLGINWTML